MNALRRLLQPSDPAKFPRTPYVLGALGLASMLTLVVFAPRESFVPATAILVLTCLVAGMATIKSAGLSPKSVLSLRTGVLASVSAGLLLLLGAVVGSSVVQAQRETDDRLVSAAMFNVLQMMREDGRLGRAASFEASRIDSAVEHWVKDQEAIARNPLRRIYLMLPEQQSFSAKSEQAIRHFAQRRLDKLSGEAKAWKVTAQYCADVSGGKPITFNVVSNYVDTAAAYTKLLGKTVTPEQLAPAVPGGYCS